jgi:hypothetical protein
VVARLESALHGLGPESTKNGRITGGLASARAYGSKQAKSTRPGSLGGATQMEASRLDMRAGAAITLIRQGE